MDSIDENAIPREVHIGADKVYLVGVRSRPWVPIKCLCLALGVPYASQARRLRRHERINGMPVKQCRWPVDQSIDVMVPLELLAWWLCTLRPIDEKAKAKLNRWKRTMTWRLIDTWVLAQGRYAKAVELRRELFLVDKAKAAPPPRPRGSRFTSEHVEAARILINKGYSQSAAARAVGMSIATLNQILNEKYPCAIRPAEKIDSSRV